LGDAGDAGDHHENRDQDEGTHEHHESWEKLGASEELKYGNDDVGNRKSRERSGKATRQAADRVWEAGCVAGYPDQSDEDQDPPETRFLGERVGVPRYQMGMNYFDSEDDG
jgi:hypothetical protein